MSKYYLYVDSKRCIGCLSCEVHCQSRQGLPAGPRPTQVIEVGPEFMGGQPRSNFVYMPCFHCEQPWCVSVCPTGAMQKRHKDGIVFVEPSLCVGCKSCLMACPWGAPQWNPETGKAVKCDYCMDRLDKGLKPACVTKCVTKCIRFGEARGPMSPERRERYARAATEGNISQPF